MAIIKQNRESTMIDLGSNIKLQYLGQFDRGEFKDAFNFHVLIGEECFTYSMGSGHAVQKFDRGKTRLNKKPESKTLTLDNVWVKLPTPEDIIECMYLDSDCGAETFQDFCDNCGYSTDSIKALKSYHECQEMHHRVRRLESKNLIKRPEEL